jgi:hypothetical protein
MNWFKRFLILKLCAILALSSLNFQVQALTQYDAAYWNMNRSMSGVTQEALTSRGYVANDPRTYGTLRGMSGAASSAFGSAAGAIVGAGTVALLGVTAPAWASVAVFAGVSAVVGYAVTLGIDSFVKWLFTSDNKIDDSSVGVTPVSTSALVAGLPAFYATTLYGVYPADVIAFGSDPVALARQAHKIKYGTEAEFCNGTPTSSSADCRVVGSSNIIRALPLTASPVACPAGQYYQNGVCKPYTYVVTPIPTTLGNSVQSAVNHIPATDMARPLNPAIVAATANRLWQQAAAQPGYEGAPYPVSNPITTAEAAAYQQANPQTWPTVANFVEPRPATVANNVALPYSTSTTTPVPTTFTTAPNPATTQPSTVADQVNLGRDPNTAAPTLENTPTAQQILNPILNLVPSLKSFSASTPTGVCPQPSLHLFGQTQTFTAHCTIFENNKATMQAAMTFAWALIAVLIILSA